MRKLLLIDGNNFAFRSAFTVQQLSYGGQPTNLIFGFLKNYISLIKNYENYQAIVCWDGGYAERLALSTKAVEDKIIDSSYKQNRRDAKNAQSEEDKKKLEDFFRQMDILKNILDFTNLTQNWIKGFEGDDLIASYVKKYKSECDIVIVSSDKDFFQLLDKNVVIFDAIKKQTYTIDYLQREFGLEPYQWVHLAAFTGDGGDNIIGVRGFGEKTAMPFIKQYKTYQGVLEQFKSMVEPYRSQFPDVAGVPYSGVRLALDEKKIKKPPFKKVILSALEQERVVELAYKLKLMKDDVEIGDIKERPSDLMSLEHALGEFGLKTLIPEIQVFSNEVTSPEVVKTALRIVTGGVPQKIYKCSKCHKEFMSNSDMNECAVCRGVVQEKPKMQITEQMTLF